MGEIRPNGGRVSYVRDGLGSVRGLSESGTLNIRRDYTPYGEVAGDGAGWDSAYGYTGEWTDADGTVYLRARHYLPHTGTFASQDPFGGMLENPLSFNAYGYVQGNPTTFTDPNGDFPPLIAIIFIGAIAGTAGGAGGVADVAIQMVQRRQCGLSFGEAIGRIDWHRQRWWSAMARSWAG